MPADTEQRDARQAVIRAVLHRRRFEDQRALVDVLRERGFEVTQSSVSRDLKELGAAKVEGAYRLPGPAPAADRDVLAGLLTEVATAGPHLLVVKTRTGAASFVAARLDERLLPGVVGTLAGDDTVCVALSGKPALTRLARDLSARCNGASHA